MLKASRDYSREVAFEDGTLRLRPIEASHIGALIYLGDITGLSPWSADCYLEEIKNPASIMLRLINDTNRLMGFVVGRSVPTASGEGGFDAEIYNIAVTPSAQKQGCGGVIFDGFIDICTGLGVSNVWLEVRESNLSALKFYQNKGFEMVQKRPSFYNDPPEDALVMRLALPKTEA